MTRRKEIEESRHCSPFSEFRKFVMVGPLISITPPPHQLVALWSIDEFCNVCPPYPIQQCIPFHDVRNPRHKNMSVTISFPVLNHLFAHLPKCFCRPNSRLFAGHCPWLGVLRASSQQFVRHSAPSPTPLSPLPLVRLQQVLCCCYTPVPSHCFLPNP